MRAALGAILVVTGLAGSVRAQPADPVEEARAAMDRGLAAARAEDWAMAREAFAEAYALAPRPLILLNLAGAQARSGRLVAASESYRRFLDSPDESVTPDHIAGARRSLSELERRIPRIAVTILGLRDGDVAMLDGATVEPGPWTAAEPGSHAVALMRASQILVHEDVELAEGEERRIVLDGRTPVVSAEISPAAAAATTEPATGRPEPTREPSLGARIVRSPWTWVAVGAVVLAVIVGASVAAQNGGTPSPYAGTLDPPTLEVP